MKKTITNLAVSFLAVGIFLAGAEWAVRTFCPGKLLTYYDSQTEAALGRPVPVKAPNEYRIFVFGESAAYGFPVSDRYSVSTWMEKELSILLPGKKIKVVNCGWPGKSSHQIEEGARVVSRYQPDLYVMYVGNNEAFPSNRLFLDNSFYRANLKLYYRSRFYRWLQVRVEKIQKFIHRRLKIVKVQQRDAQTAEKLYKRQDVTPEEYEHILQGHRTNMENSARFARSRGIDVLFMTLPSNVQDIAPSFSSHGPVSAQALGEWKRAFEAGEKARQEGKDQEALNFYEQALKIDPAFAELQFRAGQIYEKLGRFEEARAAFTQARDLDTLPFRATTRLNEQIRNMAASTQSLFVDIVKIFEEKSQNGIVGASLVFDNVHPSIIGQQLIADEIVKKLHESGKISTAGWDWKALEEDRQKHPERWRVDGALTAYKPILNGILSWESKHYEEAIPELEKGLGLMPDFIELYGFLADAYLHTGHKEKAAEIFHTFDSKNHSVFEATLKKYPDLQQGYSEISR